MLHRIDRLLVKEGGKMDWGQYKLPTQSDAGRNFTPSVVVLIITIWHAVEGAPSGIRLLRS
jgi:hypothetical protein